MSAKNWVKAQMGVWKVYYEKRDVREKQVHPAVMPIALAKKAVELFTHRGELVLDLFSGIGTTLVACQDLERNAVGLDINSKYCEIARNRLEHPDVTQRTQQLVILGEAEKAAQYIDQESVSLIFTSPPYANLLNKPRLNKSRRGSLRQNEQYLKVEQYSQDPRDLGTLPVEQYSNRLGKIYERLFSVLKVGGHSVVNVPDMWSRDKKHGKRIPLHVHVFHALTSAGYELRNTIIWDRTNIVNRVGIFGWPCNYITMGTTFEYLLDFWKPP
jgi:DNA modification methylase